MIWLPSVRLAVRRPRWCCAASVMPGDALAVQADRHAGGLGDGGGLAEGEQAAGFVRRQHDDVGGALPADLVDVGGREHRLVGGDGHAHRLLHLAQGGDALQRRRLLDPLGLELAEPADHVDRLGDAPGAVGVQPQAAAADGLAHGRRVAQVGGLAAAHLQVDDAVARRGKVAGVFGQLLGGVSLDEAEVVDLVAHGAAEQPVDRPAGGLAEDVPQRHLQAGEDEVRHARACD